MPAASSSKPSGSKSATVKKAAGSARKTSRTLLKKISADLTEDLTLSSDETLFAAYSLSAKREIYETLVARYRDDVYSYLCRYMDHPQMAEDAFQGTFLAVHTRRETFEHGKRFRPWLYAIATNQAIDLKRRNKRHRMASLEGGNPGQGDSEDRRWSENIVGDLPDPLDEAARSEQAERVAATIASLGDSLQTVIQLVYYQGMKYREAAEVLGIPVGTVKSRLHAAVQRLAAVWDATEESPEESHAESHAEQDAYRDA